MWGKIPVIQAPSHERIFLSEINVVVVAFRKRRIMNCALVINETVSKNYFGYNYIEDMY